MEYREVKTQEYCEVKTQAELDAALASSGVVPVCIGNGWFVVRGSSRVVARESSSVVAWGSSSVVAWGSSRVVAWGSSRVVAWGSSSVVARESSRVEAWGSSRVEARESSRVVAWGSSRVEAWESSRVEARESSRVVAWGSSSVEARESSSVEASAYVPVQRHGSTARVKGGVLIQIPEITTPQGWCDYYGVKVARGIATVFKAVDDDYSTNRARRRGIAYTPGAKPAADDWNARPGCGGGLHFSPHPVMAESYNTGATRYVACGVKVAEMIVLDDKVKAPRVARAVVEVDRHGELVEVAA